MENLKDKLSWMNLAGVALIIYGGASFLMEGWNSLTDLSKFLTYFGFAIIIFILTELLKNQNFDKKLNEILWSLSSITSLAIIFQVSSFLIDKYNPAEAKNIGILIAPENSILVLSAISFAYYVLVNFRLTKLLFEKFDKYFFSLVLIFAAIIIIPMRNQTFQLSSLIGLIITTIIYISLNLGQNKFSSLKTILLLIPTAVLGVRVYLYSQLDLNFFLILSVIALIMSIFLELKAENEESILKLLSFLLSFISQIYFISKFSTFNSFDFITILTLSLNCFFIFFQSNFFYVNLLCLVNFIYAFKFTVQIGSHSIPEILIIIVIAIAYVIHGFKRRNALRFTAYSGITIMILIGLIAHSLEDIQVNHSIVIGATGLGLLMIRFIFTNPKSKIMEIISTIKGRFEDKNDSGLS